MLLRLTTGRFQFTAKSNQNNCLWKEYAHRGKSNLRSNPRIDPSYNYTELGEKDSNSIEHLRTEPSDNLNNIKMVPSRLFYQDYLDKIVAKQDYASKIDIQV